MKKSKINKITNHYNTEAKEHQFAPTSTMPDLFIKNLEITKILESLKEIPRLVDVPQILDVGCGNGYTCYFLSKKIKGEFHGIDINKKMIDIAKKRSPKIKFKVSSVLNTKLPSKFFDLIYTERCLINLLTWEQQKKAFFEIHRLLKNGGIYIMLEAFDDGLNNLNKARKAIGLAKIDPAWHNYYFKKNKLKKIMKNKFIDFHTLSKNKLYFDNFLSSYYFGSRVLYPSLIQNNKIIYNNKFVEYFSMLPSVGNYSPLQLLMLKKN